MRKLSLALVALALAACAVPMDPVRYEDERQTHAAEVVGILSFFDVIYKTASDPIELMDACEAALPTVSRALDWAKRITPPKSAQEIHKETLLTYQLLENSFEACVDGDFITMMDYMGLAGEHATRLGYLVSNR